MLFREVCFCECLCLISIGYLIQYEGSAYINIASILANLFAGELVEPLALITLGDLGNNKGHNYYFYFWLYLGAGFT